MRKSKSINEKLARLSSLKKQATVQINDLALELGKVEVQTPNKIVRKKIDN